MSAEKPARPDELLVDEPRERSAALALGLGALLVVVLVTAQVGVQEAGTSVTAAAGPMATAGPVTTDPAPPATAPADPGAVATGAPAPAASTGPSAAAPPPAEPPLTDPRSVALAEQLALAGDVIFDPVTGEATQARTAVLDNVAAAVQEYGDIPVTIVGHAEPSDDTAAEQALALQRAEDVALFLRLRMVPADLLRVASAGATEAAAADPAAGNSRVSFRVFPGG